MLKQLMGASVLIAGAGPASSAVYNDSASFSAALHAPPGVETFDELGVIERKSHNFGAFTMTEIGGHDNVVVSGDAYNRFGRVSESNVASYKDDGDSEMTFHTFEHAFTAFGFYISAKWTTVFEIVAGSQSMRLEFTKGSAPVFVGFTDGAIEKVTVAAAGAPRVAFDNVTYGFAAPAEVPLPAGAGLLGLGLFGLAAIARRRRHG